ncbi:hypothetical protein LWI28_007866 [Acer negundo]|uniref:Uncharacterized protein n=1 Tax=Acer negundo TaxID=4023 RepID=A0AAD5I5U5_ACENE|nr:hypothetical protein LWI28_007866 [Acer negundo]
MLTMILWATYILYIVAASKSGVRLKWKPYLTPVGLPTAQAAIVLQIIATGLFLVLVSVSWNIPIQIGALSKLELLDLSTNHLTGSIPPEIGYLKIWSHCI